MLLTLENNTNSAFRSCYSVSDVVSILFVRQTWIMGLEKHYLRYGRTARDHILDWASCGRGQRRQQRQMQQQQQQLPQQQQQQLHQQQQQPQTSTSTGRRSRPHAAHRGTPLSMLISHGVKISNSKWSPALGPHKY